MLGESHSLTLGMIPALLLLVVPVKLAAAMVGAGRQQWGWCLAGVVGSALLGILLFKLAGSGLLGMGLGFFGMLLVYQRLLLTSLPGAFALTVLAFFIQLGMVQFLFSLS